MVELGGWQGGATFNFFTCYSVPQRMQNRSISLNLYFNILNQLTLEK